MRGDELLTAHCMIGLARKTTDMLGKKRVALSKAASISAAMELCSLKGSQLAEQQLFAA